MTQRFRKGDIVTVSGIVKFNQGDGPNETLQVEFERYQALSLPCTSLTMSVPHFEPGDIVTKAGAVSSENGAVISKKMDKVWVDFGTRDEIVAARDLVLKHKGGDE